MTEAGTAAGKDWEAGRGDEGEGEEAAEAMDDSEVKDADDDSRDCDELDAGPGDPTRDVSSLLNPCCDRFFRNVCCTTPNPAAPPADGTAVTMSGSCCECERDRLLGWSDER